jgi:hypothetical protein
MSQEVSKGLADQQQIKELDALAKKRLGLNTVAGDERVASGSRTVTLITEAVGRRGRSLPRFTRARRLPTIWSKSSTT